MNLDRTFMAITKVTSMNVMSLWVQETGTYNSQFLRPYTTNVDHMTLNTLIDRFSNNDRRMMVNPNELSDITHNILTPKSTPECEVGIVNGWNNPRARFVMRVMMTYQTGGRAIFQISGYTDFMGVTMQGAVAHDMVFYINSMVTIREQYVPTSVGTQAILVPFDSYHIHADNNWNTFESNSYPSQKKLIRPMDVYNTMGTIHSLQDDTFLNKNSYDSRNTIRANATSSMRANSLPSSYAARVIGARLQTGSQQGYNDAEDNVYNLSAANVKEVESWQNPFLKAISQLNDNPGQIGHTFTYRDLLQLDPNVDNVFNYAPISLGHRGVHQSGYTANWGSSDAVTVAACMLAQSIPAIMIDCGLTNVSFNSTNAVIGGIMTTVITSGNGISGGDLTHNFDRFKMRLQNEVLPTITYNNMESYQVDMVVDLAGETWIKIALGNSQIYDYVAPSFCDSLYTPTITTDPHLVVNVSNDFNQIVDNIQNAMGGSHVQAFQQMANARF